MRPVLEKIDESFMSTYQALADLVPPPTNPVNTGNPQQWEDVCQQISIELPTELYWLSSTYGSGQFVLGDFWIEIHSVFRPSYPMLVQWNRRIFLQESLDNPDLYEGMFELGSYGVADDFGSMGRIFWDMSTSPFQWRIGTTNPVERHELELVEFLLSVFRRELPLKGFPGSTEELHFESWMVPDASVEKKDD